jgi:FKBP-type peptidyl-prolyl cis-trans isomerase FklB
MRREVVRVETVDFRLIHRRLEEDSAMKIRALCQLVCVACFVAMAWSAPLESRTARESYAIGHDLGAQALERLRSDGLDVEIEAMLAGVEDALRESESALSDAEIEDLLAEVHRRVMTREAERRLAEDPVFRALAEENERRGDRFRARFAEEEGVTRLASGVLYRVVEEGDGERVRDTDTVTVAFEGRLIDGAVFGDGDEREVRVGSLLPGGREVMRRMRVGDRWIVVVPPDKAFGLAGQPPVVGPNETVIYEVDVLGVSR